MPKISVITINYNNALGLHKTIKSVIKQKQVDYEYIIIDGASTDESVKIITEYAAEITCWISEPDKGIYQAMNKGIDLAKGEYLIFLNSGDIFVHNNILDSVVCELVDEDLVYGDLLIVEDKRSWTKQYPSELTFGYFISDSLPHPATFIKRELFRKVGHYNESLRIVADWEFFILAVNRYNCSYKHIPITISEFMYNGISSKPKFNALRLTEISSVLLKHFRTFMPDYEESERQKKENFLLKKSKAYKLNQKLKMLLKK